jgi:hypothetical protein
MFELPAPGDPIAGGKPYTPFDLCLRIDNERTDDRIFKGAKPSELPFEQPTRYRFMINLKTVKTLGIEIPPTTIALADEVIE